ncbi:hypothetical protein Ga0061065_101141 [Marinomonas fungiae]|uniref:Uncharacterized protein n=2 Tax=Marinomonas fungiae TaxID=1137284 RepID=A0A0K6IGW1_9GAMM|nr:hypothetical protein Ga0061065_101141 [Marinomonas fungiae]
MKIMMNSLKRTLLAFLYQPNSRPIRKGALVLIATLLVLLVAGFHEHLTSFLVMFIDRYFQAQQALVDAQFFAC